MFLQLRPDPGCVVRHPLVNLVAERLLAVTPADNGVSNFTVLYCTVLYCASLYSAAAPADDGVEVLHVEQLPGDPALQVAGSPGLQ